MPAVLLNIPWVQQKVSAIASEQLEEKLGTKVRIGSVDFELLNKIVLKDLYLEDQSGAVLFQAQRLSAGFEFFPLFHKKFIFSSAQLFSFQLNLSKETDKSPLNLQFVIDAFASKDTTKKKQDIEVNIHTISIRRGNFSYHVKNSPETPDIFNPKHIDIEKISAKIHVPYFSKDSLNTIIDNLSCSEKSGAEIKKLSLKLIATKDSAVVPVLDLWLPKSKLSIENISAHYKGASSPDDYILKTKFNFDIVPSEIVPGELAAFVPVFRNFKDNISLEGHFEGFYDDIMMRDFFLHVGKNFSFDADLRVKNLSSKDSTQLWGKVGYLFVSPEGIRKMANNFTSQPVNLPKEIDNIGTVSFSGQISGFFSNLVASGIFHTDIGNVNADVNVGKNSNQLTFIKGNINSPELDINHLIPDKKLFGKAAFNIDIDAVQNINKKYSGKVNADISKFEFKNYLYENIKFNGDFTESSFKGIIDIDNPDGKLFAEGLFNLKGKASEFNFHAEARHINLDNLNLNGKYKNTDLSFVINSNFTGNNVDNLIGNIGLDHFYFNTSKGNIALDSLNISASGEESNRLVKIRSGILSGDITGAYSFADIGPAVMHTMQQFFPSLIKDDKKKINTKNDFTFDFTVENTEQLSEILDLPFILYDKARISGHYDNQQDKIKLDANLPAFKVKGLKVESGHLSLENPGNEAYMNFKGIMISKKAKNDLSLELKADNDILNTKLKWNSLAGKSGGEILLSTVFSKPDQKNPLRIATNIAPAQLIINEKTWNIHPASVIVESGRVSVKDIFVNHDDQFLKIAGVVSKDPEEQLAVALNKIDLEYIFNTLNIEALEFGGTATGHVELNDVYKTRKLSTELDVRDFSFNNTHFGDLDLKGTWDEGRQGIVMLGNIFKNDTTHVKVNGIIYPVKEELSIHFDAHNGDASFLNKYMKKVAQNVSGKITGDMHLFGDLNRPTVEGDVFVRDGGFGIELLNTYYTFTDTVRCRPEEITIKNITFRDRYGHTALANGYVKHKKFSNFHFFANVTANNMLMLNTTEKQNPFYWGRIFGSGNVTLKGTEKNIDIDVSMRTNPNSGISMNFMEYEDITEYNFINFVSKKKTVAENTEKTVKQTATAQSSSGTDIKFNLNVDATPDVNVELIVDPVGGDKIKGYGRGKLLFQYGTKMEPRLYGSYKIDHGMYNFSLQQLIYKDFAIRDGSTVTFRGDPMAAILDIHAMYSLRADPGEISSTMLVSSSKNNTVPVNCILNITGDMQRPNVNFDLELPGADQELERQVKNVIGSEDMMNRQIIYLLALGQFYTEDAGNNNRNAGDLTYVATSTLSNLFGTINDNLKIGTNIRTGNQAEEYTQSEYELLLSSQLLDNRLIINGNIGYRSNTVASEKNQGFVGDFDLEYKLTRSGEIRLKAYNHYNNDYYYLRTAPTTQGVGIMFRKDFDHLYDLFRRKKKLMPLAPSKPISNDSTNAFIFFKKKQD